jgi:hypothetical protein
MSAIIPKITIVPHCWAAVQPHYATMLRAQLSSIVKFKPEVDVKVVVVCCLEDEETLKVINDLISDYTSLKMSFQPLFLEKEELWRRSIGRNRVALNDVDSDVIWFADCDYLFMEGALDHVLNSWFEAGKPTLMWPRGYMANMEKEEIDQFIEESKDRRGRILPDVTHFGWKSNDRAIGGLQIVSGEYCRKNGYINSGRWTKVKDNIASFANTTCDIKFRRKVMKTETYHALDKIPGLYRMRHTEVAFTRGG